MSKGRKKRGRWWTDEKPVLPGVWRVRDREGGFLVRGRAVNPKTGMQEEVKRLLRVLEAHVALNWLQNELQGIRSGGAPTPTARIRFHEFAASLFERKVARGEIRSAKGREKWSDVLEHHLVPFFGNYYMDAMTRSDIESWKDHVARLIEGKAYSPNTCNGWLAILRVIIGAWVTEYEAERDPIRNVTPFDTSTHHTYTEEEPNSLKPDDVPAFLSEMRRMFPQHFAVSALGFATGLRPSSLRPLRRQGPTPDLLLDEKVLLVRRSHTLRDEVMETTKTKRHQRINLPDALMDILRWHVAQLPKGPMRDSELLFPSTTGHLRSPSALQKPFDAVAKKIKLRYHVSPRAMRRTFQDLARAAAVNDVVTRSISGHATEAMQRHYSTVAAEEQRAGLAKVIELGQFRQALEQHDPPQDPQEPAGGAKEPEQDADQLKHQA